MSESVVIDIQLNSPINKVWSALTTSDMMSKWMLFKQNNFEPTVGHKFQLSGVEGYDQVVECEVTEVDEPNTLAYTWTAPGVDNQMSETVVTFKLAEVDGGTSLNFEQSGFRADAQQEIGGATYSWTAMFGDLEKMLAS